MPAADNARARGVLANGGNLLTCNNNTINGAFTGSFGAQ
jgi:hypothetical protein